MLRSVRYHSLMMGITAVDGWKAACVSQSAPCARVLKSIMGEASRNLWTTQAARWTSAQSAGRKMKFIDKTNKVGIPLAATAQI